MKADKKYITTPLGRIELEEAMSVPNTPPVQECKCCFNWHYDGHCQDCPLASVKESLQVSKDVSVKGENPIKSNVRDALPLQEDIDIFPHKILHANGDIWVSVNCFLAGATNGKYPCNCVPNTPNGNTKNTKGNSNGNTKPVQGGKKCDCECHIAGELTPSDACGDCIQVHGVVINSKVRDCNCRGNMNIGNPEELFCSSCGGNNPSYELQSSVNAVKEWICQNCGFHDFGTKEELLQRGHDCVKDTPPVLGTSVSPTPSLCTCPCHELKPHACMICKCPSPSQPLSTDTSWEDKFDKDFEGDYMDCFADELIDKVKKFIHTLLAAQQERILGIIGEDEEIVMHKHGTCKRCGWGIKKCNCVVRNKLRAELRSKSKKSHT